MINMFEKVEGYEHEVVLPVRGSKYSAGYDFTVSEDVVIPPAGNLPVLVPTGVKAKFGRGNVLLMFPRSSLCIKKGLMLANGVGVVDSDYYESNGHIQFPIINITDTPVKIKAGERIGQGVLVPFNEFSNGNSGSKRSGGFGSTGGYVTDPQH